MSSERERLIVYLDAAELGERRPVATVTRWPGRKLIVEFLYARSWLSGGSGFQLEPEFPLIEGPRFANDRLPAILADAAPDLWGQRLMDHRAGRELDAWEHLLRVDDRTRMGALRLTRTVDGPFLSNDDQEIPPLTRLRTLQELARRVEEDPGSIRDDDVARLLLAPGSSLGGVRPKTNYVAADGSLWLAKFPSKSDRRDVGAWEQVYTRLAGRAGIDVAESDLLALGASGRTFAARRFDREAGRRRLYASSRTLSGVVDRDGDYSDIAHAIAAFVAPEDVAADLRQMYRRMVFNVLAGNRDDHLRNHGFLRTVDGWRLAPAFDLNPADMRAHATTIDRRGVDITTQHLLDASPYFDLAMAPARAIIDEVGDAVGTWREIARAVGITSSEQRLVASALASLPAFR